MAEAFLVEHLAEGGDGARTSARSVLLRVRNDASGDGPVDLLRDDLEVLIHEAMGWAIARLT
jgi:hypothetical protein